MCEVTTNPVSPSSSTRRRYLTLDADAGWTLTTPSPPADYRLLPSSPRGQHRRLDPAFLGPNRKASEEYRRALADLPVAAIGVG
jgi:hypothetical protein